MNSPVGKLICLLNEENKTLKHEIKTLKQKLQYRHTQINDLRYKTKELQKKLDTIPENY